MNRRFLFTLLTLAIIFSAAAGAVFFAKGYTFSAQDGKIVGTGIIAISSLPDSASINIDDHFTALTDTTIPNLPPKEYNVKVVKEGFIPWEKKVTVREGLVSELKITLFPAAPTLYPLTYTGIKSPVLSPDGSKLVYVVESGKKAGVWVWTMETNQPIAFIRSSEPHQITQVSTGIDFSDATFRWSPDSKEIIATVGKNNYLLKSDSLNSNPSDITPSVQSTLNSWAEDSKVQDKALLDTITNQRVKNIASASATLKWSPDETKIMYGSAMSSPSATTKATAIVKDQKSLQPQITQITDMKVYDLEEDREYSLPAARSYMWLSTSQHIVLVEDQSISVVEFDGNNKSIIYGGGFEKDLVFPWPDASRLVFITSFPTPTASVPNLYGVNLK